MKGLWLSKARISEKAHAHQFLYGTLSGRAQLALVRFFSNQNLIKKHQNKIMMELTAMAFTVKYVPLNHNAFILAYSEKIQKNNKKTTTSKM